MLALNTTDSVLWHVECLFLIMSNLKILFLFLTFYTWTRSVTKCDPETSKSGHYSRYNTHLTCEQHSVFFVQVWQVSRRILTEIFFNIRTRSIWSQWPVVVGSNGFWYWVLLYKNILCFHCFSLPGRSASSNVLELYAAIMSSLGV